MFRAEDLRASSIEAAEFNPGRSITEDSPVSYRCESQHYDPAKTGESILGDPSEIWDLPELPNPNSPDYTDEVPLRFRECIQILRDALRLRSKGQKAELEERIPGFGDYSEEYLDVRGKFSDDNSRCTRCGSWGCNLTPGLCVRQNRHELFKFFWKEFMDDTTLYLNLEWEDH